MTSTTASPGRIAIAACITSLLTAMVITSVLAPPAAAQAAGDPEAGAEVFRSSCAMCHGSDATGMMGMHPALTGAVERLGRDGVVVTIRDGRATKPPMPSFGKRLSDDQIADVVSYIETLPDGPRNFGPGHQDGMGGGMMDRMMGGGPGWMVVVVIILAAALAGVIGYLIGTARSRRGGSGPGSR